MNFSKLFVVFLLIFSSFSYSLVSPHFVNGQTDQIQNDLQAANDAINQAFNAVSDAEKAGANVTRLYSQLNDAADLLAQAENYYHNDDIDTATNQSKSAFSIGKQVFALTEEAKQTAIISSQNKFWFTIISIVIGICVFALALYLVWHWFKRKFINDLS